MGPAGLEVGAALRIEAAKIEAQPPSTHAVALDLRHLRVGHSLHFHPKTELSRIDLRDAKLGALDDDLSKWGDDLQLDGLEYGSLNLGDTREGQKRIQWLERQIPAHLDTTDFRPQPWQQIQKVLRAAGHHEAARAVAIALENRLRKIGRIGVPAPRSNRFVAACTRVLVPWLHRGFGLLAGPGQRPLQLLLWFAGVWLGCAVFFWISAAGFGAFGPSDPLVFQHPAYSRIADGQLDAGEQGPAPPPVRIPLGDNWFTNPVLPAEYSAFSPLVYSLDLLLPLVDLQQETDWAPLVPTPRQGVSEVWHFGFGHIVRLVMWSETLFGWIGSLLFVAIVSGLAKRREE